MLNSIIKETAENVRASVIWLHGLSTDGSNFANIIPKLELPQNAAIRFIFPSAPYKPISAYDGKEMRSWCDTTFMDDGISFDLESHPDIKGIEESAELVSEIIDSEIEKGINSEKILLIGFSQGGVVALHTATRYTKKLAGVANLSSLFLMTSTMPMCGINENIPVFFGYGNDDHVIPAAFSEKAFEFFKSHGNTVEKHIYHMHHEVCLKELEELGLWMTKLLVD